MPDPAVHPPPATGDVSGDERMPAVTAGAAAFARQEAVVLLQTECSRGQSCPISGGSRKERSPLVGADIGSGGLGAAEQCHGGGGQGAGAALPIRRRAGSHRSQPPLAPPRHSIAVGVVRGQSRTEKGGLGGTAPRLRGGSAELKELQGGSIEEGPSLAHVRSRDRPLVLAPAARPAGLGRSQSLALRPARRGRPGERGRAHPTQGGEGSPNAEANHNGRVRGDAGVPADLHRPHPRSGRSIDVNPVNAPPPASPSRPGSGSQVSGQIPPAGKRKRGRGKAGEGILVEVPREDTRDLADLSRPLKGRLNEGVAGIAAGFQAPGSARRINAEQVERPAARVHNEVGQPIRQGRGQGEGTRPQGGVPGQAGEKLVPAKTTGGQSPQLPGRSPDPIRRGSSTPGLLDHEHSPTLFGGSKERDLVRGGDVSRKEEKLRSGRSRVRRPP